MYIYAYAFTIYDSFVEFPLSNQTRRVNSAIGSISFRIPKCSMETCYTIRPSPHLSYSLLPAISLLLASSSAANRASFSAQYAAYPASHENDDESAVVSCCSSLLDGASSTSA